MTLLDAKSAEISWSLYLTKASRVKFTRPRADLPPARIRVFFLIIATFVRTGLVLKYFRDKDADKERKTSD
jgi:hypothetical protein